MKTYKARPIGGETIPDLLIEATEDVSTYSTDDVLNGTWREMLTAQSKQIVDAMYASLPGGILHGIFAEMAYRRACELAVALQPDTDNEAIAILRRAAEDLNKKWK